MKRPNINEFISDVDYMLALDDYADHLERWMEEHDILFHNLFDDDSPESGGGLTLTITEEDNPFGDGTTGEEWPDHDKGCPEYDPPIVLDYHPEDDDTRRSVMVYILNRITGDLEGLRELIEDEST